MADDAIDLKTPEAPSSIKFSNSLRSILQSQGQKSQDFQQEGIINNNNENGSSSSSFFSSMSLFRYFLIILILAFLGINLFGYMEVVTNYIVVTFKPLLGAIASFFGISIAQTTTATVDVTSKGLKKGIDITSDTIKKGASILKDVSLPNKIKENNENMNNNTTFDDLDNKLNNKKDKNKVTLDPLPDNSNSSIQNKIKKNYCFIGSNNDGSRTCAEMYDSDKCMSGDIFPSLDICINPKIR